MPPLDLDCSNDPVPTLVAQLADALRARGESMATAESCTGGLISAACTELAGSSEWFDRGFVTYSNAAKSELIGVPPEQIAAHGAVSMPVAHAMATGAVQHGTAQWAVAVTGIAGPGGGSAAKPVGTVCFGWAHRPDAQDATSLTCETETCHFIGDRAAVRQQTVAHALNGLLARIRALEPA